MSRNPHKTKLSVIGLGNLGLPLTATLANKYKTTGMDINPERISLLKQNKLPISEPNLKDLIQENSKNLSFTTDAEKTIKNSSLTFIVVPTPSKKNGSFSLKHIKKAIQSIAPAIKEKKSFHTLVITSTINPNSSNNTIIPYLEEKTNKKLGKEIGIAYHPELIALGSVIHDLQNPEILFFAASDQKTKNLVKKTRLSICKNSPPIKHLSFIDAEISKLALNSYITTKISFANLIARYAENTKGANAKKITQTIGQDSRVGTKYFTGAIAYGGPCFPRDNQSFIHALQQTNTPHIIPQSIHRFNKSQHTFLENLVTKTTNKNQAIGILGLSYKPKTDIVEESPGLNLAQSLVQKNYQITVFDPQAKENTKQILKDNVKYAKSLKNLVQTSQTIIITTPWKEFEKLPQHLSDKQKTLIDCWQQLPQLKNKKNIKYISLGKNNQ